MKALTAALERLDDKTAERVLKWAAARFTRRESDMFDQIQNTFTKVFLDIDEMAKKRGTNAISLTRAIDYILTREKELREQQENAEHARL